MAQNQPLHIDAGATYSREFTYANPAGGAWSSDYNCKLVIRDLSGSKVIDIVPILDRATGSITFTLTATQTSSLTQTRYKWALELIGTSQTLRLLQGRVTVSPELVS